MKAFSNEMKSRTLSKFMTWLLFVLIMQAKYYAQDTGNQCNILGRLICWKWHVLDYDKTSEKQKLKL